MQRVAVRAQGCVHMSVACTYVGQDVIFFWGGGIKQPLKKNKTPLNTHSKTSLSIRRRAAWRGGCVWCVRASTAKGKKKKKTLYQFPSR